MLVLSGLLVAALLAGHGDTDKRVSDFGPRGEKVFSKICVKDGIRVARKRVRSKKKPRTRAVRARKSTPKPTARPTPVPTSQSGELNVPLGSSLGRTTRIEFDAQLIKGQTTKAGEVQILERKDVALTSMVKRRTSFREEIIQTVFPDK